MVPGTVRDDALLLLRWTELPETVQGTPELEGSDPLQVLRFEDELLRIQERREKSGTDQRSHVCDLSSSNTFGMKQDTWDDTRCSRSTLGRTDPPDPTLCSLDRLEMLFQT